MFRVTVRVIRVCVIFITVTLEGQTAGGKCLIYSYRSIYQHQPPVCMHRQLCAQSVESPSHRTSASDHSCLYQP